MYELFHFSSSVLLGEKFVKEAYVDLVTNRAHVIVDKSTPRSK